MEMTSGALGAVGYGLGYVFTLWPLIVLSPIRWKKEDVLAGMIIAWALLLFGWLFATTFSTRPLVALIPEPINTYLFFLTGLGLLVWGLWRETRRQRLTLAFTVSHRSAADLLDLSTARF